MINPGSRVFQIIRELLDFIAIMICEYYFIVGIGVRYARHTYIQTARVTYRHRKASERVKEREIEREIERGREK